MSRSGYSDDCSGWELIRHRGAVASAIRGERGQRFLREMLAALDALPAPRLIAHDLEKDGEFCALGTVGARRGIEMSNIDPYDYDQVAATFGVARALVQEIEYENDESYVDTPEQRFKVVRAWVVRNLKDAS